MHTDFRPMCGWRYAPTSVLAAVAANTEMKLPFTSVVLEQKGCNVAV